MFLFETKFSKCAVLQCLILDPDFLVIYSTGFHMLNFGTLAKAINKQVNYDLNKTKVLFQCQ